MKHILHKMSYPGWIKVFDTEEEAKAELFSCLCNSCQRGDDELHPHEPYSSATDIDDMLWTSCGAEYDYETAEGIGEQDESI